MTILPTLDSCSPPDYIRRKAARENALHDNWRHTYNGALNLMSERIGSSHISGESILAYIHATLEPANRQQVPA